MTEISGTTEGVSVLGVQMEEPFLNMNFFDVHNFDLHKIVFIFKDFLYLGLPETWGWNERGPKAMSELVAVIWSSWELALKNRTT